MRRPYSNEFKEAATQILLGDLSCCEGLNPRAESCHPIVLSVQTGKTSVRRMGIAQAGSMNTLWLVHRPGSYDRRDLWLRRSQHSVNSAGRDKPIVPGRQAVPSLRIQHLDFKPFAHDFGVTQQCVDRGVFVRYVFQFGKRRTIHTSSLVDVGQA